MAYMNVARPPPTPPLPEALGCEIGTATSVGQFRTPTPGLAGGGGGFQFASSIDQCTSSFGEDLRFKKNVEKLLRETVREVQLVGRQRSTQNSLKRRDRPGAVVHQQTHPHMLYLGVRESHVQAHLAPSHHAGHLLSNTP